MQPNRTAPASATSALIVEGGAMRGIFSTGVLDGFLAARFNPFDLYFGVSSGAGNLAAYLADMPERNFKIYTDYTLRPEFIDPLRFLRGGHLMDLDWLWKKTIAEICPPDDFRPTRLGRDDKVLVEGYRQGLRMAGEGMRAWAACDHGRGERLNDERAV